MTELSAEALDRWAPPLAQLDPDGDDVFFVEDEDDKEPSESTEARSLRGRLFNVGLVRLPTSSRLHDYDAGELTLRRGDEVVVQSERGQAIGVVVAPSIRVLLPESLSRRILRRATANDHLQRERDQLRAGESVPFVKDRVSARRLPMKLVCVERVQGGNKAIFYFSAEGRVDFRDLVKDLAQNFRSRIEMRQIGVRDEAKMVGGIGICGLRICCHRYLTKFEPVSIRMAKDQNLVLNPQKVSGQCGRLKCCLAYEQEAYREQRKGMPKLGKTVVTPDGEGKVVELDILRRMARVLLAQGGSAVYRADELGPRDAGAHPSHDQDSELGEEGFDGEEGPGAADGTEPTGAHLPHRRGGEERPGASLSHGQLRGPRAQGAVADPRGEVAVEPSHAHHQAGPRARDTGAGAPDQKDRGVDGQRRRRGRGGRSGRGGRAEGQDGGREGNPARRGPPGAGSDGHGGSSGSAP